MAEIPRGSRGKDEATGAAGPDGGRPEILDIEQAAALLGVSVKTFNKVLHSECIPGRKIGREWKFSRQALIDWVGGGRSEEFYREAAGSPAKPGEKPGTRRSGWRIELD